MRCVESGVDIEMITETGMPYYKIQVDRYGCKECENTILVGFADHPYAHHFEDDYAKHEALGPYRFA
jgi:hypothetical protein